MKFRFKNIKNLLTNEGMSDIPEFVALKNKINVIFKRRNIFEVDVYTYAEDLAEWEDGPNIQGRIVWAQTPEAKKHPNYDEAFDNDGSWSDWMEPELEALDDLMDSKGFTAYPWDTDGYSVSFSYSI